MSDNPETEAPPRPVVLCILDGWGERSETRNNAIALGDTPNWDRLVDTVPRATLDASETHVGLPAGQMGNSEVGHMNLGAGRVVMQDLPRIDAAVADGSIFEIAAWHRFVATLRETGGTCHLMGLMSPGGVHSHQDQLAALARGAAAENIPVRVHALMDGRDTPPSSGLAYLERFGADIANVPDCRVATVGGRYYAMDRDKRWERVEKGYDALVSAAGVPAPDANSAMQASYDAGVTDEFVLPAVIDGYAGMADGDGILMGNFRADRAREILTALTEPGFSEFARTKTCEFPARLGMVEYSAELNARVDALFPPVELNAILGEVVSSAGLKQLRIAETEKYAHVTFFLNGGREAEFSGEDRILVPSPKIATYDLQPEMSAPEVTDKLVAAITGGTYDLIIVNYANGDMVGHTGVLDAAIRAAATIDSCLGRLEAAAAEAGGTLLVTADHGNCENMFDETGGEPHTQHTLNVVPILLVNGPKDVTRLAKGRLCDVAPTVLDLMGLEQPPEMTGRSLIADGERHVAAAE